MREAVIVSSVRTPVGRCRGAFAEVPVEQLGAAALKEAVQRTGIDPSKIDHVVFSNLMNNDVNNMARMVLLAANLPVDVPGMTLDRQCSSSLDAFAMASMMIEAGFADIVAAGGVESDSRRPYVMERPSFPYSNTPPSWGMFRTAPEQFGNDSMVATAQKIADRFGITREECDAFAYDSQMKANRAWEQGRFEEQIVPVSVKGKKGEAILVVKDETLRPETTIEGLASLKSVSGRNGIVTAGNSSPMSDGGGAVVVMERMEAEKAGVPVLAKFKAYAAAGVEPAIMGSGPIAAVNKLFKKTGMSMADIDLVEMNEAFASQSVYCKKALNIPDAKLNVNGGAIALGHPLAGTGAILITKMVYELKRRGLTTGLITFCVGGGQGVAVVIENVF